MDTQSTGAGIAPLGFAIGITVVLVGLIVSPLVIDPLGGAITLVAGLALGRANHSKTHPRTVARPTLPRTGTGDERYSRSRLGERATLDLGGLVALAVGQRRQPHRRAGAARTRPLPVLEEHWRIAWAGFDTALAAALAVTGVAGLRRALWLDPAAVALATTEAVAVELPVALLCIWVAQRFATPAARERNTLATAHEQGVLQ